MLIDVRYFKRFRMERALPGDLPPEPPLPDGYFWLPWDDVLLDLHAHTKYECFRGEPDIELFPSLGTSPGCERLMRAIRLKPGFLPGATWLLGWESEFVGTVQGVRERSGWGAIQNLGVVHAHRGRGLGEALMRKALHGFRAARLPGAFLEVTAQNDAAIRLYRKLGFRCRKTIYKTMEDPHVYPLLAEEVALR